MNTYNLDQQIEQVYHPENFKTDNQLLKEEIDTLNLKAGYTKYSIFPECREEVTLSGEVCFYCL